MPANFSSMVGEFIVATIPKYCPTVVKNTYHNGHPDILPRGMYQGDSALHAPEGIEVKVLATTEAGKDTMPKMSGSWYLFLRVTPPGTLDWGSLPGHLSSKKCWERKLTKVIGSSPGDPRPAGERSRQVSQLLATTKWRLTGFTAGHSPLEEDCLLPFLPSQHLVNFRNRDIP